MTMQTFRYLNAYNIVTDVYTWSVQANTESSLIKMGMFSHSFLPGDIVTLEDHISIP